MKVIVVYLTKTKLFFTEIKIGKVHIIRTKKLFKPYYFLYMKVIVIFFFLTYVMGIILIHICVFLTCRL